jgi:hypothetical protein
MQQIFWQKPYKIFYQKNKIILKYCCRTGLKEIGERTQQALLHIIEMTDFQDEESWPLLTELTYFFRFTTDYLEHVAWQMQN